LYDGEDKGVYTYKERILNLDTRSQEALNEIMSEEHEHLKEFNEIMKKERDKN